MNPEITFAEKLLREKWLIFNSIFNSIFNNFFLNVAGVYAELYYVRDGEINDYALNFVITVPAHIHYLCFTWQSLAGKPVSSLSSLQIRRIWTNEKFCIKDKLSGWENEFLSIRRSLHRIKSGILDHFSQDSIMHKWKYINMAPGKGKRIIWIITEKVYKKWVNYN